MKIGLGLPKLGISPLLQKPTSTMDDARHLFNIDLCPRQSPSPLPLARALAKSGKGHAQEASLQPPARSPFPIPSNRKNPPLAEHKAVVVLASPLHAAQKNPPGQHHPRSHSKSQGQTTEPIPVNPPELRTPYTTPRRCASHMNYSSRTLCIRD